MDSENVQNPENFPEPADPHTLPKNPGEGEEVKTPEVLHSFEWETKESNVTIYGKTYDVPYLVPKLTEELELEDLLTHPRVKGEERRFVEYAVRGITVDERNAAKAAKSSSITESPEHKKARARDAAIKDIATARTLSIEKATRMYERMLELEDEEDE